MSSLRGMDDSMGDQDQGNNDSMDDDDNAQMEEIVEAHEDPLVLAMEDLEGRVVTALDDVKSHPGVRSSPETSIHEELAAMLRPVLEVAAHTAPSVARTYYRGPDGIEACVEESYSRVVSDLVLPVLLEMAQSDTIPAKRAACLEFFRLFFKECSTAGSWLDKSPGPNAGPYGPGGSNATFANTPAVRVLLKRRQQKAVTREGEILRYWVEASNACLVDGVFTAAEAAGGIAGRAILAASSALRPSLRHVSQKIKDADDRGASRLYNPVMKMIEGVLKKMFAGPSEAILAACIKFLEIVVMCCSPKPQDPSSHRRRGQSTGEGFSLSDLPTGHPQITRENLELIAEYAFTAMRGFTIMAGQVRIDQSMIDLARTGSNQTQQVVSILKPAALAYLEIESSINLHESSTLSDLKFVFDESNVEYDFKLAQKSYSLTVNAVSAVATQRPIFFKEASVCLARRAIKPPEESEYLPRAGALAIASQLRSSCLTLLRNALSITSGASSILHNALGQLEMQQQAEKALKMANQAHSLKTANRATRNQALVYYEWDASDSSSRTSKRQRETDDVLAKRRAEKKARGLGGGIQLPTSTTDAIELVLLNIENLPSAPATSSKSKSTMTFDSLVEAIMTNGSSLAKREGGWYNREGGSAWKVNTRDGCEMTDQFKETIRLAKGDIESENDQLKLYREQCGQAASAAYERILSASSNTQNLPLASLSNQLAARLSFLFCKGTTKSAGDSLGSKKIEDVLSLVSEKIQDEGEMKQFSDNNPVVASSLTVAATSPDLEDKTISTLGECLLNEALLQSDFESGDASLYDRSLEWLVASAVHAGDSANKTPSNLESQKAATTASSNLKRYFSVLPRLSARSIVLLCAMCDTETVGLAVDGSRKSSQEAISNAAASHAAKQAAEKRAKAILLVLRDVVFQRDGGDTRKAAVAAVVGLASGRMPSSFSVHDNAMKLLVNAFFPKNSALEDLVVQGALSDLEWAASVAVDMYEEIQSANEAAEKKKQDDSRHNPMLPRSDEEKKALEKMRKPTVLMMALCLRRPELIRALFSIACRHKADVLSKAVRLNMGKLRGLATPKGAGAAALRVAEMTGSGETPLLLSFMESLSSFIDEQLLAACFTIQENRSLDDGTKDPRFLIPVVAAMKRKDLIERLPQFVQADDPILLAALVRMGEKIQRQALQFRDEPDEDNPTLVGLTLCEQLVFLHHLDFTASSIPQKRYLTAITICLNEDEVYNDRVIMSALDHMSETFRSRAEKLPLAFMRSIILISRRHETLLGWICNTLLPRLVEAEIFTDLRQWEGWMRCAKQLERDSEPSSKKAIEMLPREQLMQYRSKFIG